METPLRIAYCSVSIAALVVLAAYSAALISFLTVSTSSVPFTSLEDFAGDGTYALTVLKHNSEWDFFHVSLLLGFVLARQYGFALFLRNVFLMPILQFSKDPLLIKTKTLLKPFNTLPATLNEAFDEVRTKFYVVPYYAHFVRSFLFTFPKNTKNIHGRKKVFIKHRNFLRSARKRLHFV